VESTSPTHMEQETTTASVLCYSAPSGLQYYYFPQCSHLERWEAVTVTCLDRDTLIVLYAKIITVANHVTLCYTASHYIRHVQYEILFVQNSICE